jgi:hypothetical protein
MKTSAREEWRDKQRASAGLPGQPQMAARARERGERDSAVHTRDRLTVDLCGIASAVKAEAKARRLTLAAFARVALVASLQEAADDARTLSSMGDDDGQTVKLTLRLPAPQASWLVEHARAAGLSYGTFLASVIEGAPCPASLAEAVRSLTESTDQMAVLARDLNAGMRLLASAKIEEARKYRQQVVVLFDEVRQHLRLTSALAGEVRRAVRFRATDSNRSWSHGSNDERALNR